MYSIEDLSNAPKQLRNMSDEELKSFCLAGSKVLFATRGSGVTVLHSLGGSVTLPNHTLSTSVESAIEAAVAAQRDAQLAAKDKITAENARRREVMGVRC